jgi:CMP-N-acetylneuraminic acid synthetase
VVSTEDAEVAEVARGLDLDVPFRRPAELAGDATPMLAVVRHALATLEADGDRYDAVCLLQPTCPFRAPGLIDACIERLAREDADAVCTVTRVPTEYHPYWAFVTGGDGALRLVTGESAPRARRQDLPPAFIRDGAVYVTRRDVVMEDGSLYGRRLLGHEVPDEGRVNIDEWADWRLAELLLDARATTAALARPETMS